MGARNVVGYIHKGNRDRYLRGRDGEGERYGTLRTLLRAVRRGTAESRAARIHGWKNGISEVIVDRVFDRRVHFVVNVGCKIRNVIVRHDAHCDAAAVRGRAFYLKVADGRKLQFSRRLRSGNCSELVCALSASGSMCRQRQDDGYCLCVFFCAFSRAGAICKTRVDHGEIHAAAFSVLTRRIVPVINGSGGAGPRCRRDVDARLEFIDITQADRDRHRS